TAPENAVLVVAYIGFKKQEISVNGRTQINIVLSSEVTSLEEVVVVGYGTVQKSDLTGSISQVKIQDVNETKAISISEALQGKLVGVNIVPNTGEPGGAIPFNIRGMTSVTGSN